MNRIIWLCPLLMLALAAWVFMLLGFSVWSAVLMALLLVCPAIMIYGMITLTRHPRLISPETLHTRGMPLDVMAPVYDRWCPMIGLGPAFRQETLRHAGLKPGEHVLDAGCGTGVLTMLAAGAVGSSGRVVGIDPAARMISIAQENAARENSCAEFRLAAIENLPFEDNSFDCVLSSLMIHHLPPDLKLKGLAEVCRVLKPGGRLVAADVDKPVNLLWWLLIWPLLLPSFTSVHVTGGLDEYFRQAGFEVDTVGHWKGILSFWLAQKPEAGTR